MQPHCVRLQYRHSGVEGNRKDRTRRVAADSRKFPNGIHVARKHTAMLLHNLPCRQVELPCPAVISQPLPEQ